MMSFDMSSLNSAGGDSFMQPEAFVASLPITQGMSVADLGAGTGHITIPISRAVGPHGKVWAVDIQKDLITTLQNNARSKGVGNTDIIWGDLESIGGTKLKDNAVDMALVINTFFIIQDKQTFLSEVWRIVKSGGRVVVADWTDSFGGMGPAPMHIVSEADARAQFESKGFVFEKSIPAGAHHYAMILRK